MSPLSRPGSKIHPVAHPVELLGIITLSPWLRRRFLPCGRLYSCAQR